MATAAKVTAVHRAFRPVQLTAQKDAVFEQRQPLGAVARVSQVGHPDAGAGKCGREPRRAAGAKLMVGRVLQDSPPNS